MKDEPKTVATGWSVCGALAVVLVGLKLAHEIDWPWVIVLAPIWAPFALLVSVLVVVLMFVVPIAGLIALWEWSKRS